MDTQIVISRTSFLQHLSIHILYVTFINKYFIGNVFLGKVTHIEKKGVIYERKNLILPHQI